MTLAALGPRHWAHLLWVVPLLLVGGAAASPAQAGGERIVTVAKDAVYGGATGLLLGGVLALVLPSEKRDDAIRWGVVVGTFAGFGYGLYESQGPQDGFSELVRTRADARLQARRARMNASALASARTTTTPGGPIPARWVPAIRLLESPRCWKTEERPEPATGGANGRTS
jgi:hypothetical protein